jgi:PHD/YefM family antitoxin component YafN of YafNO toxin-antitoxin module
MTEMRVTSVLLHQNLGQIIDMARVKPVMVTKHDRDHVVILSAERYALMASAMRTARLTGSLTSAERATAAAAEGPNEAE